QAPPNAARPVLTLASADMSPDADREAVPAQVGAPEGASRGPARRSDASELTLIEGAVLGLLIHEPRHGFALVPAFSAGRSVGRVFQAQAPVVYRALRTLEARGLVASDAPEATPIGPSRV